MIDSSQFARTGIRTPLAVAVKLHEPELTASIHVRIDGSMLLRIGACQKGL
jgi:hypothetical protein